MSKIKKIKFNPTNQERIQRKQWWSSTFGWVDLQEANDGYFTSVYNYWFFDRRQKMVDKVIRINKKLTIQYSPEQDEKNRRRMACVHMNDNLINKEYIRRMLAKK